MKYIIGLVILGLVFTFFEVLVPGGILGVLAAFVIIWAVVLSFQNYGLMEALGVFIVSLFLIVFLIVIQLKVLSKTQLGKKMFLNQAVEDQSTSATDTENLIGKEAEAQTPLAPSGKIIIDQKEYEAFSEDGLIKAGEKVKIVSRDNFRIVVKKN